MMLVGIFGGLLNPNGLENDVAGIVLLARIRRDDLAALKIVGCRKIIDASVSNQRFDAELFQDTRNSARFQSAVADVDVVKLLINGSGIWCCF